jgi:hypothetical protein
MLTTESPRMRPADLPSADAFFPLLLGRGKLARHLHHYLHLIDFPHKHYDQSLRGSSSEIATPELDRKLLACNVIWLMVSDQAIAPVLATIQKRITELGGNLSNYTFLHSSAATEVKGMQTFHPLMTFGPELYAREQYEAIPFASFQGESEKPIGFPFVKNPHFEIPSEKRAFYHACAVMMSNLPVLLWSKVAKEFQSQTRASAEIFEPILKQTLSNFLTLGEKALTGPIARNDQATIQKNLASLEGTPLFSIYQAFAKEVL